MFNPDAAFVALVLFVSVAALLFPGGPDRPRRARVQI